MKPDIDLMQYADGELDPTERAEVEAALADDPVAAAKVASVTEAGELVRGHLELAADTAEPRLARLWFEIEKVLDNEPVVVRRKVTAAVPAVPTGLWARITRWIDTYRGHVLTGALSAGAVAAVALVLRPNAPPQTPIAAKDPAVDPAEVPVGPTTDDADPIVMVHTPAEVESLDVPGGTGTVFTIQGEDGEETTVIWVTPNDTLEGI